MMHKLLNRGGLGAAALSLAVAPMLVGSPTAAGAGAPEPDTTALTADAQWSQSPVSYVYTSPSSTQIAGNANVSSFTVPGQSAPSVLFSWSTNEDVGTAAPDLQYKRSTDGGSTFPGSPQPTDTSFATTARVSDGSLIDIAFIPFTHAAGADQHYTTLRAKRSTDNGATWTPFTATIYNPYFTYSVMSQGGLRVNPNILTGPDGALYISYYTRYSGDHGTRVEVAKSTNGGANWTRIGPIITSSTAQQYNETALSWTPDGRMMAVITQDEVATGSTWRKTVKLITARSTDGARWGEYAVTPISFDPGYSFRPGPDGQIRYGVSPDLELLPNGVMALRWGRPDNWFAISVDGGQNFIHARRTYVNWNPNDFVWHGSSGNGSLAVTGPNTVVISGDNCAPTWGCPQGQTGWTIDDKYKVWRKTITITP